MQLWLVDINPILVKAWKSTFSEFSNVNVIEADILSIAENTIVSPANSYGFMDGGIDQCYTDYFGLGPQEALQKAIARRTEGYLPVGASILVQTNHPKIPYMIAAPTMITPGAVPASHCFYAMIAILNAASRNHKVVKQVFCPGLATHTGRVAPEMAAEEMAKAYRKWQERIG